MARLAAWLALAAVHVLADLVALVLTVALLAGVVGGALAWRLAAGPLDVSWLATRLVAASRAGTGPTRLSVQRAALAWAGYHDGVAAPLRLQIDGLRAADPDGTERARLDRLQMEATPDELLSGLATGQVLPAEVSLQGLHLRVVRAADGRLTLDLGGLDRRAPAGAAPPASASASASGAGPARGADQPQADPLGPLRRVRIADAVLDVVDQGTGVTWHVSDLDVDAARTPAGLSGHASGDVQVGAAQARLTVEARRAEGDGASTMVHAALTPVPPAALAAAVPALAGLAGLTAPVSLDGTVSLDAALRPRTATLHVQAAAGQAALPAGAVLAFESAALDLSAVWEAGAALPRTAQVQARIAGGHGTQHGIPFVFDRADLDADAVWTTARRLPDQVRLKAAHLVLPSPSGAAPTTVLVAGQAAQGADGRIDATLALDVDQALAADLPTLWPGNAAHNARTWVTESITAGIARNAHFDIRLGGSGPSTLDVTDATGTFVGENLTVHWLRPAPPATNAYGVFHLRSPAIADITIQRGAQGRIQLRDGLVHLTGLNVRDQDITIALSAAGSLADVVALLRHPRLKLLSKHPLPLNEPAGQVSAKLDFAFPLKKTLDFDDITLHVGAQLSAVRLRRLVAGRDLERGQLHLDATAQRLRMTGQALLAGIPSRLAVDADFRPGPPNQVLLHAAVDGQVSDRQLAAQGVDAGGILAGVAGLSVTYDQRRNGRADVGVRADLRDAAITTPVWSKPRGVPAQASAGLVLLHDTLASVERLHAEGPDLLVDGSAELADGKLSLVRLSRARLGRTDAVGEIRLPQRPGDALGVALSGSVLDLAPYVARRRAASRKAAPSRPPSSPASRQPGTPFRVDVRFAQVLIAPGLTVRPLVLQAESDGRRILRAQLEALPLARGIIAPDAGGRRLDLAVADFGTMLRALDVTGAVSGGQLRVQGQFDDRQPGGPLRATAELTDFKLFEAVLIGKILQAVTLYGVLDAIRGPGLAFTRAVVPFTYSEQSEVLELQDARAFSSSLGLTVGGRVDLGRDTLNLRGTIVPAYFFNSLLGRIPYIGRVFSPERGGGLVSAEYALHGALDDPGISVNPLTLLTPGILRKLFHIAD